MSIPRNPLFAPVDDNSNDSGTLTPDDILDVLNEDDSAEELEAAAEVPDEVEKDEVLEELETKPEEEEKEVELKDDDDEIVISIPRRQEILKAYPDIFKKFPSIESAIYREQQFSEVFPSIADAKQAVEDVQTLRTFEADLASGNIEGVLKAVKQGDEQSFDTLTNNYLQTLQKVDNNAFLRTIGYTVKSVLKASQEAGKNMGGDEGEQLQLAVQYVARHLFGKVDLDAAEVAPPRVNPEEGKLKQEREKFEGERLQSAVSEITDRVKSTINSFLEKNLDPKGFMTPYVRQKAFEDAMNLVDKEVSSDNRFRAILNNHWKAAKAANYDAAHKSKIRKAILDRAKISLPNVIRQVRADALKGISTRTREAGKAKDDRPIERGRPATTNKAVQKPAKNLTTLDYLMQD
jgi:hypothetical protein